MNKKLLMSCTIAATLIFQGCANTIKYDDKPASKTVEKGVDSNQLSASSLEMVESLLNSDEVKKATKGTRPLIAVFGMIDFTADKLDLATINGHIYGKLDKANRFRFADPNQLAAKSKDLTGSLYDLVEDGKTGQTLAQSLDADYMLVGEISNVIRTQPKTKQVFYRVTLKLLDSKKGEFVWQDKTEFLKSEKNIIYGI